jgi:hypothetical protein
LLRYRNLQHGRHGFAPCLDRGFLDLFKIVEADGVAPVPLRYRNNIKAGDVEAWNSGRLLKFGERFENAVLVITRHDDQYEGEDASAPLSNGIELNIGLNRRQ